MRIWIIWIQGIEIYVNPDPGLDFSKNLCFLRDKSKKELIPDENVDLVPDPRIPKMPN